jgi:hypothetical protein
MKGETMTPQKTQTLLVGVICVLGALLAFVLGILAVSGDHHPAAPSVSEGSSEPAPGAVASVPPDPVTPPAAPEGPAAAPPQMSPAVALVDWTPLRNGCEVEVTGTRIHVFGVNSVDGWGNENGVTGRAEYPPQDFEVSTDFMLPRYEGPGTAEVILMVRERDFRQVTLQFKRGAGYQFRWWTKTEQGNPRGGLPEFGDEAKAYHRLRIKYEAATRRATSWADDKLVDTLDFEFKSNVRFVLAASGDKKGNNIDLYFERATLSIGNKMVRPGSTGRLGGLP